MANLHYLSQELWADIEGYEGLYQASTQGQIRSLPKIKVHKYGNLFSPMKGLKGCIMNSGYITVTLHKDGVQTVSTVHTIMANTFLDKDESKPHVNHINGIKHDNRLVNIERCSRSANMIHAFQNGLISKTRIRKKKVF